MIDASALNELLNYSVDEEVYDPEIDTIPAKIQEAEELLQQLRAHGNDAKKQVWSNCEVEWLEWYGSRRRPRCEKYTEDGCIVEFNGKCTYTITTPSGKKLNKRKGTRGLSIWAKDGRCIEW